MVESRPAKVQVKPKELRTKKYYTYTEFRKTFFPNIPQDELEGTKREKVIIIIPRPSVN